MRLAFAVRAIALFGTAHDVLAQAPRPCPAERLLWNGICQPAVFPPRDLDVKAFRHHPRPPTYLAAPPATIDIDVGRQLFVDDFLLENTTAGVSTAYHQAEVAPVAVLRPTTRWEGKSTKAYSGGVWWDPTRVLYTAHYACSGCTPCHLCMATSVDGVHWTRPPLQHDGSNCVHYDTGTDCRVSLTTTTVWLDLDAPNPNTRYKLAEVPHCEPTSDPTICPPASELTSSDHAPFFMNGHFRIFGSSDGVEWKLLVNYTGVTGDRATMFKDALRDRWVFSIKATGDPGAPDPEEGTLTELDRWRMFHQTPSNSLDSFSGDDWSPRDAVPWLVADALDPPWMGKVREETEPNNTYAGLYNFDAVAYESVLVGLFDIYRCKGGPRYGCPLEYEGHDLSGHSEFDSLYLGWSRDGFQFARPGPGQPWPAAGIALSKDHRTPFIPMADSLRDPEAWNWAMVQSVGGGFVVSEDKLTFFVGSNSNTSGYTGTASLRRDGFASLRTGSAAGEALTRPLRFRGSHFFVNSNASTLRVEVANLDGVAISPFTLANSRLQATSAGHDGRVDSTKVGVSWTGASDLRSLAGTAVRIRFSLGPQSDLYAFWVSRWDTGESAGYVAAGGPAYNASRDVPESLRGGHGH